MRSFHKVLALLTVLALLLAVSGCFGAGREPTSEPTTAPSTEPALSAAQIFSLVSDTMSRELTTYYRVSLTVSCRYPDSQSALELVTGYALESEIVISDDPFGRSNVAQITVTDGETRRALTARQFDVLESGTVVTYSQTGAGGAWTAADTGLDPESYIAATGSAIYTGEVWPGVGVIGDLSADLSATVMDGTQVYTLHGSLPFRHFQTITEAFSLTCGEDVLAQALPVVWYVDAGTFSIVRAEVDLSPVSEVFRELVTASLPEDARETADFTLSRLVYELGTGPQTVPALPPDARETDGTKVLSCGSAYVFVHCPEGWRFSEETDSTVTLQCGAASAYIQYLSGVDEGYFQDQADAQVAYLEDLGLYKSHSGLDPINGFRIVEILTSGTDYYYAWKEFGEGTVFFEVSDYYYDGDAGTLMSLLTGSIAPYDP